MKKLNVEDLSVIYHGKHKHVRAVDRVSFSIDAGDSLGIIGESGSGKSTMINAFLRLLPEKPVKPPGTSGSTKPTCSHAAPERCGSCAGKRSLSCSRNP